MSETEIAALTVREWQARSAAWIARFPGDDLPQRGLVDGEEAAELLEAAVAVTIGIGRVQRCILKAEQDIRGGTDYWLNELRGELADVFFALTSTAHRAGFDLADAVEAKWARIEHKEYAKGAIRETVAVDDTTRPDCGASVRRSTVHEARFCPMCGSPLPPAAEGCPHVSWSGDEGPIATLGRFPKRWRCDGCGVVKTDA